MTSELPLDFEDSGDYCFSVFIKCPHCGNNITGTAICVRCEPERVSVTLSRYMDDNAGLRVEVDMLQARVAEAEREVAEMRRPDEERRLYLVSAYKLAVEQRDEARAQRDSVLRIGEAAMAHLERERDEYKQHVREAYDERDLAVAENEANQLRRDLEWDVREVEEKIAAWLDTWRDDVLAGFMNPEWARCLKHVAEDIRSRTYLKTDGDK